MRRTCESGAHGLDDHIASPHDAGGTPFTFLEHHMPKTSLKNVAKQKKKARRVIPRAKVTRIQGNTAGVRKRLKKMAAKTRVAVKA